jgi:hypothetical protein
LLLSLLLLCGVLHLLQVTIKAADSSISRDARKDLVAGISQALPQHLQCLSGDRIYMWVQPYVVLSHFTCYYVMFSIRSSSDDLWPYAVYNSDCCMVSEQGYDSGNSSCYLLLALTRKVSKQRPFNDLRNRGGY